MNPTRDAVAQAARALRDSAKEHKRASMAHRRGARKCMEALSKLGDACKALGIDLQIGEDKENDHGRSNSGL